MIVEALLVAAGGLVLLLGGGELLLRGAVALATRLGLSPLLIGMTVVAAATSMPELVVAVTSGLEGVPDIGVGNAVGSNIANILLILGAAAVFWPIATRPRHILRDGLAVLCATVLFMALAFAGEIGRIEGLVMLTGLAAYLTVGYLSERRLQARESNAGGGIPESGRRADALAGSEGSVAGDPGPGARPMAWHLSLLLTLLGAGALVGGSHLLVDGAVAIARAVGVSEAVIGLTMIAIGTSLPELATAVIAAWRHHPEIALGNVLGSNLFNILAILAALALTTPFRVAPEMLRFDVWVMAAAVLILLPVMFTGWRIGRREGALFLLIYGFYVALRYDPTMGGLLETISKAG